MLDGIAKQQVIRELEVIEERFPGALDRIYNAAENGDIAGWTYDYCVLQYVIQDTDYTGTARMLSDELAEDLYQCGGFYLTLEELVTNVDINTLPQDSEALQELQDLITEVQNS